MTKDEAWRVIEECRNWNVGQQSMSRAFGGPRTSDDDVYDARRFALELAWRAVGYPDIGTADKEIVD